MFSSIYAFKDILNHYFRTFLDSRSNDKYKCDCTSGYTDQNCETKKDFCEVFQQPCKRGSTCVSKHDTEVSY